jgi:ribosomal protein S18 acetylase RimI-like enzyme
MFGGMAIMQSGQGIGRQVIQKIFKDNPNIQHITLYTTDQAIGFWKKLKGKVLGEKDGVYYMQIDRTALNEKAKSSPGRVKRAGASCKGSVTDLRARAKKYGGEKGKMYHWCANMKSGKKK